ncbi:YdeI/OmpD-associated family protein [uncultured Chryseobacterium sp.]|uniref:YdeI/OmpD-associated family protein n=1 Tax=uncultured Chryseobacterium sp. TaxID=259322 RepID=UPI0025D43A5D|nr:YdeI/OmpD-associated family protein [uncultured Chryseobacterium sp.]
MGKTFGDEVSVSLVEDKEERIVEISDDIALVFKDHPDAKALFDAMSYTHRKEYIRWIAEAKKQQTREARKAKMITMILAGKREFKIKDYLSNLAVRNCFTPPLIMVIESSL